MKIFLISFIFFSFSLFSQDTLRGRAVKFMDGDTFDLLDSTKTLHRIRVADIDCPERGQPFGKKAKEFIIKELVNKQIIVVSKGKDRYNRVIGFVKYDNKDISEELLKNGLAWHYIKYSKILKFSILEKEAKENKKGLWIEPKPTPPWIWRRR